MKTPAVFIITIAALVAACSLGSTDASTEAAAELDPGRTEAEFTAPAPKEPWYGDWRVAAFSIPGIAAATTAEAAARLGQTAAYAPGLARFDSHSCERPRYRARSLTAAALYEEYRLLPAQLGLAEPVTLIAVECASGQPGPGGTLLIKGPDTMLTPWDGAFFELRRR